MSESQEERAHHDYSPSTLQSLEACSCWQGKQSAIPHPRTIIGSISHGVTETGEDDPRLSDEDADKVAECIDFYERRRQIMQQECDRANNLCRSLGHPDRYAITELKEQYLEIDDEVFTDVLKPPYGDGKPRQVRSTTGGYTDCSLINHDGTYAEMFDWKFGFWPVEEAKNNLQGVAYSLGLFRKYPKLKAIRFWFLQPNIEYITDETFTRENVSALYLRLQVVVAKARAARHSGDFSTAKAYVPACNFCRHIAICPVVSALACKVGSKFYPVEIPADITPTKIHDPADTKLGLQLAQVLEVWAKSFKSVIAERAIRMDADPPEGYKLTSRTPREIKDSTLYREVALKYLTDEEYATTLKAAFGSVEDLISSKAPRGEKKARVEQFGREAEESGAVVRGDSYIFLQAVPKKPTKDKS